MREVGNGSELQVLPRPHYQVTLHNKSGSQTEFFYVYKYLSANQHWLPLWEGKDSALSPFIYSESILQEMVTPGKCDHFLAVEFS